jgi:PPOX class probable F420-dependent enzyme
MATIHSVIPESHADLLKQPILAYVATTGLDGAPQNNPVWFDWDGEFVRFSQVTTTQKYHNLQRDPRIALAFVDPNDMYRYLEIRGAVERFDPDPDNAFMNSLAKRYMGLDVFPYAQLGEDRRVVVVRPKHTTRMG